MTQELLDESYKKLADYIKRLVSEIDELNAKTEPLNRSEERKKSYLVARVKDYITKADLSNHLTAEEIAKVEAQLN